MLFDNLNWKLKSMKKIVRKQCKVDMSHMKLYKVKRKATNINQGNLNA